MKRLLIIGMILMACSKKDDDKPITSSTPNNPPTKTETQKKPASNFVGSWQGFNRRISSATQILFTDTVTLQYIDSVTLFYNFTDTLDVTGSTFQSRSRSTRIGMLMNDTLRISDSLLTNQFNWDYFKLP